MALLPVRALPRPNPAAAGAIPGAICWFRGSFWSKTSRATAVSRVEPLPVPLCGPAELLPGCWSLRLLVGPVWAPEETGLAARRMGRRTLGSCSGSVQGWTDTEEPQSARWGSRVALAQGRAASGWLWPAVRQGEGAGARFFRPPPRPRAASYVISRREEPGWVIPGFAEWNPGAVASQEGAVAFGSTKQPQAVRWRVGVHGSGLAARPTWLHLRTLGWADSGPCSSGAVRSPGSRGQAALAGGSGSRGLRCVLPRAALGSIPVAELWGRAARPLVCPWSRPPASWQTRAGACRLKPRHGWVWPSSVWSWGRCGRSPAVSSCRRSGRCSPSPEPAPSGTNFGSQRSNKSISWARVTSSYVPASSAPQALGLPFCRFEV